MERNAATDITNDDKHQQFCEKCENDCPKSTVNIKTKPCANNISSNIAKHLLVDSVWPWISKASPVLFSADSSFQLGEPAVTFTTGVTIVLILLLSLVVGNREYLLQAIEISPASSSISIVILYASLSVFLLLPFLLWLIIWNTSRIDDIATPSKEVDEEPNAIGDEFETILPLGLKQPTTISIGVTNENAEDHDEARKPTPQLASSKHIRMKLAEWLPFGLRYTSDLNLVFSTNVHGRSLQTLYHILETTSSNHTIMLLEVFAPTPSDVLQPRLRTIIGMYASQRWYSSPKNYGDGRCFLFRFSLRDGREIDDEAELEPNYWKWTSPILPAHHLSNSKSSYSSSHITENENSLSLFETFQRSNHGFLGLGISASGVGAGLQLNHDMTKGESHRAVGFNNEPLCCSHSSTETGVFEVGLVEVYQLVREIDGLPIQ